MSHRLNIFKGLLLIYIVAIVVFVATVDWLYDEPIDTPIYRINNVNIIDYHILNAESDTASLKYFWCAPPTTDKAFAPNTETSKELFHKYHPYIKFENIPDELIVCGNNPDKISPSAALIQVKRVEKYRKNLTTKELNKMIYDCCDCQFLGIIGPEQVNIVMLNQQLDR